MELIGKGAGGLAVASTLVATIGIAELKLDQSIQRTSMIYLVVGLFFSLAGAILSVAMVRGFEARRRSKRVFIVFSHADMKPALRIAELLREHGFKPWLDVEDLLPGQIWKAEIERAIGECGVAIVILSENLEKTELARHELALVLKRLNSGDTNAMFIIPVRVDNSTPPDKLMDIQHVNLDAPGAEERLLKALSFAGPVSSASKGSELRE